MKRNHFNLGYSKKFDMKVGLLYPTYVEDMIAGDIARIGQSVVVRAINPPTAPITDSFKFHTIYVAIPKRLTDRYYVRNMTGTKTGDVHGDFKCFNIGDYLHQTLTSVNLPHSTDFDLSVNDALGHRTLSGMDFSNGSLADYMSIDYYQNIGVNANKINVSAISAYYMAYNFLFRNAEVEDCVAPLWDIEEDPKKKYSEWQLLEVYEHLRDEEGCDFMLPRNSPLCEKGLMRVHWRKDYFTDVTLSSQRGTSPTVPVNFTSPSMILPVYHVLGNSTHVFAQDVFAENLTTSNTSIVNKNIFADKVGKYTAGLDEYFYRTSESLSPSVKQGLADNFGAKLGAPGSATQVGTTPISSSDPIGTSGLPGGLYAFMDSSTVSLNSSFSVTDLRSALVISHFMEMNNKGGFKWAEFLITHFGTCPSDETLSRPLLLGTWNDDIYTSEVVQTSEGTNDTLGTLAGHMLGVGGKKGIVNFKAKEPMTLLGLSWISVERNYETGVNRMFLKQNYLDEYFSVFNGLGPQAIDIQELNVVNQDIGDYSFKNKPKNFAFNERYSHLMSRRNEICGRLRSGLAPVFDESTSSFKPISQVMAGYENYYHNYAIGECYSVSGKEELNTGSTSAISPEFLAMNPQLVDVFTSSTDVPFVVSLYNRADFFRPIPIHCMTGVQYV